MAWLQYLFFPETFQKTTICKFCIFVSSSSANFQIWERLRANAVALYLMTLLPPTM